MLLKRCTNRGRRVEVASESLGSAGPDPVRRHRTSKIFFVSLLLTAYFRPIVAFRGPHHPRSSVSHHHYIPEQSVKLTQDEQLLHDAAHLAEDMGSFADKIDTSKMTDQELEFYYFKVHDVDNNTQLDGLELFHALQHPLHTDEPEDSNDLNNLHDGENNSVQDYSWIVDMIDRVLEEDDLNNDGYLGYTEYVLARKKNQDEAQNNNGLQI